MNRKSRGNKEFPSLTTFSILKTFHNVTNKQNQQTWELCRSVANMMMEYANTYAASALVKISSLVWAGLNIRSVDKDAWILSTRPEKIEFDT